MAGSQVKPPMKIEKKIGSTTYVVTSHFSAQGSTAQDKIKRLLDTNTKIGDLRRKI